MSLLPLGILSSSGAGGVAAFELISTTNLGSNTASVSFSSIVSTYKHLQIRYVVQTTSNNDRVALRINGDTSTNYTCHQLYGNGVSVSSNNVSGETFIRVGSFTSNTTNIFTPGIIDILDYTSTSKNKTVRAFSGKQDGSTNVINLNSGMLISTSAISSLTLLAPSSSFTTNSRFSLYGIKG